MKFNTHLKKKSYRAERNGKFIMTVELTVFWNLAVLMCLKDFLPAILRDEKISRKITQNGR
jgi:hypothetical protein